jgi:hypothetical protein
MSSKLIIKSHQPWKQRLKIAGGVVALVVCTWAVFSYGFSKAGYDNKSLLAERVLLREQLDTVKQESQQLHERIAMLERAQQIDKQAYGEVELSLKEAQNEMLELKEEVAFYRSIVSPSETASGVTVTGFSLEGIGEEHSYRFKLVLSQLKTNNRVVKGYARVVLEGLAGGVQKQLALKELTGGALDRLKLRFKYFQNIEGDIVLPEGFLPSRVIVEVVPDGKGWTRFKKTFDWSDIVSEG